jgi:hypothetical protein
VLPTAYWLCHDLSLSNHAEPFTFLSLTCLAGHHKLAAKVAAHARIVCLHAMKLLKLKRKIKHEAATIAGAAYKECHGVGNDEYGSMESQRSIDDDAIRGQGLVDVVELTSNIAAYAARVAAAATPPPLPSE